MSGFARPSSSSMRPNSSSSSSANLRTALQSSRRVSTGNSRPLTNLGREVRLGTASLSSGLNAGSTSLVNVDKFNIKKYIGYPVLCMAILDYFIYVEHNIKKAYEICIEVLKDRDLGEKDKGNSSSSGGPISNDGDRGRAGGSSSSNSDQDMKNWWWMARLGKCYYKLGLFREAEQQFKASLKLQPIISTYLELVNVYLRLDLPNSAIDLLLEGSEKFIMEPRFFIGIARIYEELSDFEASINYYKRALVLDSCNIESISSLGGHYFYLNQPELSIRYYRRLLQMGMNSTEVWNNLGLCCFYASQYDLALNCFEKSLILANDEEMSEIWYNIGHIGVALGDLGLAYQAFKVSVSINPNHAEGLNNLAVLEMKREKYDVSKLYLYNSCNNLENKKLYEPFFNQAILSYRMGEYQEAYKNVKKSLEIYPNHFDSKELMLQLENIFCNSY